MDEGQAHLNEAKFVSLAKRLQSLKITSCNYFLQLEASNILSIAQLWMIIWAHGHLACHITINHNQVFEVI
jgi:hypothetical protein